MLQCEDEWNELHVRFSKEGLDYASLSMEQRILHVWRWLVDAESNLLSSRKMLDKLREQQHEELEVPSCANVVGCLIYLSKNTHLK